ncbi:MAG: cytochrome P450 [Acidimicrobiales bacterium]
MSDLSDDRCASFDIDDPGFCRDPFPTYDDLREQCPVLHSDAHFREYGGYTLLTRYDDVKSAVTDWRTYSSAEPGVTAMPMIIQRDYPLLPVEADPPDHARYRALISPVFRRSRIEALRPAMVRLLDERLDHLAAVGSADLVADVVVPFSTGTLGEFMKLPAGDRERWAEWGHRLFSSVEDPEDARRATAEIEHYLDGIITEREGEPRDDFISMLMESEVDGHRLSRAEIRSFGMLVLASAGHETSASAMSMALYHLAHHPEALDELRARPELLPAAVEEMLRYATPVQIFCRNATRDVSLRGTTIPAGSVVATSYGAANTDPAVFDDAHEVRLDRSPNPHLTFGAGPHFCIGAPIARLEMELLLAGVADRFESIDIPDEEAVVWSPRGDRRGIWELPATVRRRDGAQR